MRSVSIRGTARWSSASFFLAHFVFTLVSAALTHNMLVAPRPGHAAPLATSVPGRPAETSIMDDN